MAEQDNGLLIGSIIMADVPGRQAVAYAHAHNPLTPSLDYPLATSQDIPQASASASTTAKKSWSNIEVDNGYLAEGATVGWQTWFESFHVLPRSFAFGNVLSTQVNAMEVYSAFRKTFEVWTSFQNNAGVGVDLNGLPSFPHSFPSQTSGGLTLELVVSTSGQPVVDDVLAFVFSFVPQTINVPITLQRVVLFAIQPELPFTEKLRWLTEVLGHVDGTEQRLSARKNPRQSFVWDFIMEDGPERAFFSNLLFDWQSRVFGLPIWYELTRLTSAAVAADTTLTVGTTDYADYRVGGLAVIFESRTKFDVLEVDSITATTIVFTSGILNNYAVGTFAMPLRTGNAQRSISGSRWVSGDARMKIEFRVNDNDVDLADSSAFSVFNSKVLIDGHNSVRGEMSEQFERDIIEFDNGVGVPSLSTAWDVGKRLSQLALLAFGRQGLWEVRQLLHALRGKQISFYAVTFSNDFTIDSDITAGDIMNVVNVGYAQFAQSRQPRNIIRIIYNNGDPDDYRTITSAAEVDTTREALTLDSSLAARPQAEVEKIMFVEKVRWDTDEINIRHERGDRMTRITGPIKTVLE